MNIKTEWNCSSTGPHITHTDNGHILTELCVFVRFISIHAMTGAGMWWFRASREKESIECASFSLLSVVGFFFLYLLSVDMKRSQVNRGCCPSCSDVYTMCVMRVPSISKTGNKISTESMSQCAAATYCQAFGREPKQGQRKKKCEWKVNYLEIISLGKIKLLFSMGKNGLVAQNGPCGSLEEERG